MKNEFYEVRWRVKIERGHKNMTQKFKNIDEAKYFARKVERAVGNRGWCWQRFWIDGYVDYYDGIYFITEEMIYV